MREQIRKENGINTQKERVHRLKRAIHEAIAPYISNGIRGGFETAILERLVREGVVIKVSVSGDPRDWPEFYPVESLLESPKGESNANRPS